MDLQEYLRLLRRRWKVLAACVLVAGVAAWVTTPAEPTNDAVTYTATHQLLRDASAVNPPALATVSLFVKTGEVPKRAAERLDYSGEPAVLAAGIELEPDEQVGTLELTAKGNSRSQAVERANVFAEELLAFLGEQAAATQREQIEEVNGQLSTLQAEIDALDDRLDALPEEESNPTLEAQRDSKLRQYGAALDQQQNVLDQPPPSAGYITLQAALPELATQESGGFSAPSSRPARTAFALVIGLVLGLGAVLLVERLDTRIHDSSDAGLAFDLPVVAEIPVAPRGSQKLILTDIDPMSAVAESYRTLRSSLLLSPVTLLGLTRRGQRTEDPQVILVTSPAPGDGKTTTVANLAAAMAESGRSVLVLGCDFRRPEVHSYFEVPPAPGIADVLTAEQSHDLAEIVRTTSVPGVSVAPSGSRLRSFGDVAAAGRSLIEQARELADIVIIDTAPLLATNDASELIPACDAVVVVSRMGKTTVDGAKRTRVLLERLGAPVAGVVALAVPDTDSRYASYSSYYVTKAPVESGKRRFRRKRGIDADEISDRIGQFRGSAEAPTARRSSLPEMPVPAPDADEAPTPGDPTEVAHVEAPADVTASTEPAVGTQDETPPEAVAPSPRAPEIEELLASDDDARMLDSENETRVDREDPVPDHRS